MVLTYLICLGNWLPLSLGRIHALFGRLVAAFGRIDTRFGRITQLFGRLHHSFGRIAPIFGRLQLSFRRLLFSLRNLHPHLKHLHQPLELSSLTRKRKNERRTRPVRHQFILLCNFNLAAQIFIELQPNRS